MGMIIDGIAAAASVDTSGEIIDIAGLDISSLESGEGTFIYEHRSAKSPGATGDDVVGSIRFAKKIFDAEDCDDARQKKYWDSCKVPFVYIRGELFDDEKHAGAQAITAIINYYHSRKMPILMRYSIDGHTIKRGEEENNEQNIIKRAIARDVAVTMKPCNKSCVSGVIDDAPMVVAQDDEDMVKSERGLLSGVEFTMSPMESNNDDPISNLRVELDNFRELQAIQKAISLGNADVAPSELRGASALGREDLHGVKNRLKAAVRDWDGKKSLKDHLVKSLPDASPDFLEKFSNLIDKYRLYKASQLHGALEDALNRDLKKQVESAVSELPKFDSDATGKFGKPTGDGERSRRAQQMALINADARRSNPEAGNVQDRRAAFVAANPGVPSVDHSTMVPDPEPHAMVGTEAIAHINNQIKMNSPVAAKVQSGAQAPASKDINADIANLPQVFSTRDEPDDQPSTKNIKPLAAHSAPSTDDVKTNVAKLPKPASPVSKSELPMQPVQEPVGVAYKIVDAAGQQVGTILMQPNGPLVTDDPTGVVAKMFPQLPPTSDSLNLVDKHGIMMKFEIVDGVPHLNGVLLDKDGLDNIRNHVSAGILRVQ